MVYTALEKRKFENILNAFADFIREQDYFDIVYSEKMGYVQLLVKLKSEPPSVIETAEEMIDMLCYEVISEAVFAPDNVSGHLTAKAEAESRSRLTSIIMQMEENQEYYLDYADKYVRKYREEYDKD